MITSYNRVKPKYMMAPVLVTLPQGPVSGSSRDCSVPFFISKQFFCPQHIPFLLPSEAGLDNIGPLRIDIVTLPHKLRLDSDLRN